MACESAPTIHTGATRLQSATDAITDIRFASYRYSYRGTGSLAGDYEGSVRFIVAPGQAPAYRAELRPSPSWEFDEGIPASEAPALILAAGRENVAQRDEATGTFRYGTLSRGSGHLVANVGFAILFQLTETEPFAPELEGVVTLDGQETVGGVLCDVVRGTNPVFGDAEVTWYIGAEDDLPRGHRFRASDGSEFVFEIHDLDVSTPVRMENLAIASQRGEEIIDEDARPIEVGALAPDWALEDASGQITRLSSLRGSVVVLDVGASWCAQCQSLSAAYDRLGLGPFAETDVRFLALNTWESPDVLESRVVSPTEPSYPTLLGGETVAMDYKLASLPALFVVDPDGRFAVVENPVSLGVQATADALETVLENLTSGMDR